MDGELQRWVSLSQMLTARRKYIVAEVLLRIEETGDTKKPKPWVGELKEEIANSLDRHHPSDMNT